MSGRGRRTGGGGGSGPSGRGLSVRVKSAGRRPSSVRWLERQLNDPYVAEARKLGYRSRAAFKLLQLDEKFHLLKPGRRVVDLGAAPGGWTQVAAERVHAGRPGGGAIVAIDVAAMAPLEGATILQRDFLDAAAPDLLRQALGGPADLVLSDMAAPTTGHVKTDHLKVMALAEAAHAFAAEVLAPGGAFVTKVLQGGATLTLLEALRRDFAEVRHVKPAASRSDSAEIYVVATGFRGARGDS